MLVSHHGGPGSNTEQFMWDLLWKIWHCDRYFPKHFAGFPLSVSFHQYSISFTIVCIARSNWRSSQFTYITISPTRVNRLTPNDPYMGHTAPLTSKRCILYIYSTNVGTVYFKRALYSPFLSLQNAVCFITLTSLIPVLFTFYIQGVLKWKKIPAPKG